VTVATDLKAPTTELGAPARGLVPLSRVFGNWIAPIITERELQRDLTWPRSNETYASMLNDAQIEGLYRGTTLPIRAYDWYLEPNGARPEVVDRISADYNLPVGADGEINLGRGEHRFRFDDHLEDALRAIVYGHYPFEQVYDVRQDGPAGVNGGWVAHLRKLAPRPPRTLSNIRPAPDGGLAFIKVPALNPNAILGGGIGFVRDVELPVDRLVMYVWDKEGANWRGRSMMRSLYRPWKLKDRVMRVGAINIERAGGVPYIEAPEGATTKQMQELHQLASSFRVGESAGAALPHGAQLKFAQAAGGDAAINFIRLQNEEAAGAWLMMFKQLGQTQTGSRSLAGEFIDYFELAQHAIAGWAASIFSRHVIDDDVELNEGPNEPYAPLLAFKAKGEALAALQAAIEGAQGAGALPADSPAAAALGMTRRPRSRSSAMRAAGRRSVALASEVKLPERTLRRQPNTAEMAAAVDFATIEQTYLDSVDELAAGLDTLRAGQIADLVVQVRAAGEDLEQLAHVSTDPVGADEIAASMRAIAESGAADALQEARHQGVDVAGTDLTALEDELQARAAAVAQTLAVDVSNTAARAAVRLSGATGLSGDLADNVETYLNSLQWQLATDAARGVLQGAANAGRFGQFQDAEAAAQTTRYYHSALLDTNTCGPCADQDGYEYADLQDVEASFGGTGGYALCEGAERCRCTAVAVYDEAAPTLQ
jgi:hypothetical protein